MIAQGHRYLGRRAEHIVKTYASDISLQVDNTRYHDLCRRHHSSCNRVASSVASLTDTSILLAIIVGLDCDLNECYCQICETLLMLASSKIIKSGHPTPH